MAAAASKPAVIVLSSHVARGSVGGRGALTALEQFGHAVWYVPTVMLAWHPGHGRSTRIETPLNRFSDLLDDLAESPALDEVGAIITGYFADPMQAVAAAQFIDKLKRRNSAVRVVVDPIMGDRGQLYVHAETAGAIRDWLVSAADVTTPNLFELSWLTGAPTDSPTAIATAARQLAPSVTVVTSVPALMRGSIGTMLVTRDAAFLAEHRELTGVPNGTGDLLTACLTARLLAGQPPETALQKACATVFEMVARSVQAGSNELRLQAEQDVITHPMADVPMRRLAGTQAPVRPMPTPHG
jgi:pyridoxine kinase